MAEIVSLRDHPYAPFVDRVRKPAQYLGGEQGEVRKDWDAVDCRLCLAFPDLYEIGMSHLGYKILYDVVNRDPRFTAERAYAAWPDMEAELRAHRQPLCSLESAHALREFDIVGFSLQYELTYTNVLQILDLGQIPLLGSDRTEGDPLIVAGGPTATHAEPMAPFIDAFLIGDGEKKLPELMEAWATMRDQGLTRHERLVRIASLDAFYVPSLYRTERCPETQVDVVVADHPDAPFPVRREILESLDDHPFPVDGPVPHCDTVFDRASVEIARGCTEGCRFCQAGMIYRPVRERSPTAIVDAMVETVSEAGYDEASLTSLSTADYSAIAPLVRRAVEALGPKQVSLSVSSLRAYGLGEEVLDDLKSQRAGGLTFAPEAGSQRMRDVINKNVTDAQLMETAERVFSRGWSKMKLYFMIGLPTEEDEDVAAIVDSGARALGVARRVQGNRRAKVTVSVSTHVPKPHTPFQWCAMDTHDEILRKQALLTAQATSTGVRLRMHSSRGSWLEGMLARGDRRLAPAIASAFRHGARFDSWDEHLNLDAWNEAIRETKVRPDLYLGTIPVTARLPWDHIDVGLAPGFLAREYRKALRNRLSPPCGKTFGSFVHATNIEDARADARPLVCYQCGVACDLSQMREERVDFLRDMEALTPRTRLPLAEQHDHALEVDRRPFRNVNQGPAVRLRLGYTKLGRAAYGSHLDMVRNFPRMLRRVGLPLYYSEGFRPLPKMTFGPALPVGTSSLAEHVDIRLRGDELGDIEQLTERLNAVALSGLEFFGHAFLGTRDRALNRVIDEIEYIVGLSPNELHQLGAENAAELSTRLAVTPQPLSVWRDLNGLGKRIDVGAALAEIAVGEGGRELSAAGLRGDLTPVRILLRLGGATTPRPREVLTALTGVDDIFPRVVRTAFYSRQDARRVSPLDLQGLRQPRAEQEATP